MEKQSMGLAREIVTLQHLTSSVVQPRALAIQAVGRINLINDGCMVLAMCHVSNTSRMRCTCMC